MIKTIGLIGAGSVGGSLFSQMYKEDPDNLFLVATGDRASSFKEHGITVNNERIDPQILSEDSPTVHLDLLIVAVKTYGLEQAMKDISRFIDEETIILPIQNGIMATENLKNAFPNNRVLYGIVLRTDAHRMGRHVYFNTLGEMQLGYADNRIVAPEVQEICDRLVELGINARIYEDMRKTQWRKWMLNTGASQAAAEIQVECGYFGQVKEIEELMKLCMNEILEIAKAEGVNVTEEDRDEIIDILLHFPHDKKMSMLQDLEAGRPIEIDEYAGTVIKLGEKHGIPTPVNKILYLTINARRKIGVMRKHIG